MQLSRDNYYSMEANCYYLSVSQFKDFVPAYGGCESRAMAILSGAYLRQEKDAFDEGHYIHSWNAGELDDFKENNPDLFSSRGPTKGNLKSNFRHCDRMIAALESDPLVIKALAGRKEVILSAELFGVPWKIMIDSYNPEAGLFTDLKAIQDAEGKWWNKESQAYENFLDHYGYKIQLAIYAEIERISAGRKNWLIPHMVVVTKQEPPDHDILYFDYELIAEQLAIVGSHIERVKAVKSGKVHPVRCERCDYCRTSKKIERIKHYAELNLY